MGLKESLDEPVSKYMSAAYATVGDEDSVYQAAMAMKKVGATEAIVTSGGNPVGIITERDILYKVVAAGLVSREVKAKDAMSSPLEGVEDSAKVADAIAKMSKLGLRRLVVTRGGQLVGLVTQKAVVSGSRGESLVLPELASPSGLACPYCDATMKTQEELSKHIDRVHLGMGLLEGNRSKW